MAKTKLTENLTATPEEKPKSNSYSPIGEEKKVWEKYLRRKDELLNSRNNVSGLNINQKMREWDRKYFDRVADIPPSELDPDQSPISINRAFGKIQTALGIMINGNPELVMDETCKKYVANRELMRGLANNSWKNTNSIGQFKLSVFNCAKRGWFAGRTFNKIVAANARYPMKMDEKGRIAYETREIVHMDDIAYKNLDNHNVWLDEQAMPEDMYSLRDAMHRELWHIDDIKKTFPKKEFPNMQYVHAGGNTQQQIEGTSNSTTSNSVSQARENKRGMTELFFYENSVDDWFIVEINGVMVIWEPLPQWHKRLSYTTGLWNLRTAEDIYGIGIIEAMEKDETLIDRILNMSMRQLLMSINPPGFYSGTEDFEDENIKLKAGVLRRTLNANDIKFVDIPEMKKEGLEVIGWLEQKEDSRTGITNAIESDPTVQTNTDTAFELGLNKESAMKRLRIPLQSFQYALSWEMQNRIALIQQTYSDFQVDHIAEPEEIQAYLDEVGGDPSFYYIENEGVPGEEKFFKKQFREVSLALEQDDSGKFLESDQKSFFKIKPEYLAWQGTVQVDIDSLLVNSEQMEQQNTLKLTNLLIPMIQLGPEIALKPSKQILQAFKKDPKKWLPDSWVEEKKPEAAQPGSTNPAEDMSMMPSDPSKIGQPPASLSLVPPGSLNSPKPLPLNATSGAQ